MMIKVVALYLKYIIIVIKTRIQQEWIHQQKAHERTDMADFRDVAVTLILPIKELLSRW